MVILRKYGLIAMTVGGVVLLVGCGGGGGTPPVSQNGVCNKFVPQWTKQTRSIQSVDDIKKALSPAWIIKNGDFYMLSKGAVQISEKSSSSTKRIFKRMASGKWMLQTLDKRKEASLIGIQLRVADQNWTYECQFGGTLSFTNDSVENDFKYTYRFSECEDSSEIMEKLFDALFNGEPMAQPEPESNDTIFHYNGTVSEELKECGEESCAYAEELSFNASQFSATTVRSDEDVNGSFGMNLSLWAGAGPDSDDIHYASLQADGCVAIDGTDNDGYLLKANLSFNRLNVDINSTTEIEPLVRQQGKSMAQNHSNEPERVRVNLDGYAGLQGQFREDDESNLTSLDSYQFYAEGVTIDNVYDNDSEDDNLTVSGKFGDACMQGVVTYQGTVGPQWNDKSVPMDGNLSLNDGEATVVFNEENVTFLNNSGGILQTFVGGPDENVSWDDLTDPQCSKIYRDLLDNFFPFQ